jgi:L-ascorbate metabolism protein UlaG (beta-lactamase superfamily)
LLREDAWQEVSRPDVLMLPIGGRAIHNTMDEKEALRAVEMMQPKLVIPCHYNCPALFTQNYNPADEVWFAAQARRLGAECRILRSGDSTEV